MNNSLVIFTQAERMLAEAVTIQATKELKDLALTAADWAKRKGMGEKAINHARGYALEAERKMGQMLKATERAKGAAGVGPIAVTPIDRNRPTLSDLGLTKNESAKAQSLADIPQDKFDEVKSGKKTRTAATKKVKAEKVKAERAEIAKQAEAIIPSDRFSVSVGDMQDWASEEKFDFVITDPPYIKEYLPLYETLAIRCNDWLKPGGLLVAMCGQSYLDQIYSMMSKHLDYYWTAAYLTPGQPTPLRQRNVNTTWKPLLIFSNGEYHGKIFGDVFRSDGNDKSFHKWGQSISGMVSVVSGMCLPGQTILDPFCGAGTTGIAALKYGCLFTGIDVDSENVNISISRLSVYDTPEE